MVSLLAVSVSCGLGGGESERQRADSLEALLMQYIDADNQKSLMLMDYEQSISSFGNFLDSIKIREMAIDSLKSVLKRKGGGSSSSEARQIRDLVKQMQDFIAQNQDIAVEFQKSGYKNATAQQLMNLMINTIESKQKEITSLASELASLKIKVRDLEDENAGLVQEIAQTTQQKEEAEQTAAKLSLSNIKITLPDVRKAKKVDSINIRFNINENKYTQAQNLTVYIRITDQKGNLLTNSETGFFDYQGRQIAYTTKKTAHYSGKKTPLSLTWHTDGITLTPGQYTVTFFMDDVEPEEAFFNLKKYRLAYMRNIDELKKLIDQYVRSGMNEGKREALRKHAADMGINMGELLVLIKSAEIEIAHVTGKQNTDYPDSNDEMPQGSGFVSDNQGSGFVSEPQGSGFVDGESDSGSGFVSDSQSGMTSMQNLSAAGGDVFTEVKLIDSSGAMSDIYSAVHLGRRKVIIKRIKQQYRDDQQYIDLFYKEFDNAVALEHN
ncbi:MAG: hypothetical protein J6V76_02760, partial [Bacteroidales bacterium]|nr:hypothetical protein [Bacteroidales bacterium]